jgi:hypothetical protein
VCQIYVDALVDDPDAPYTRFGKLTFVDLAGMRQPVSGSSFEYWSVSGSENLKKSGTKGKGIKETGAINKSLFALGICEHSLEHLTRPWKQAAAPNSCSTVSRQL